MATMQEIVNALYAQNRQLETRLADLAVKQQQVSTDVYSLIAAKKEQLNFRETKKNEAAFYYPKWYAVDATVTSASTAQQSVTVTVTSEGWFFIDRIYATWRETSANHYRAISSGGAMSDVAVGDLENEIDFTWEYIDGRTNRSRMNQQIPGDILFRFDRDGYTIPDGDPIAPTMQIQVNFTPLHVTGINGILTFVFAGMQCIAAGNL